MYDFYYLYLGPNLVPGLEPTNQTFIGNSSSMPQFNISNVTGNILLFVIALSAKVVCIVVCTTIYLSDTTLIKQSIMNVMYIGKFYGQLF